MSLSSCRLALFMSFLCLLSILVYYFGIGFDCNSCLGSNGLHSSFILLIYHDMLYLSWGYSFEDDGSTCGCASCLVCMIHVFFCSYCCYYCSLYLYLLLLAFVESVSLTRRLLAGNPSRRINLPFVYNLQRVISIKLNLESNCIKTLLFFLFS